MRRSAVRPTGGGAAIDYPAALARAEALVEEGSAGRVLLGICGSPGAGKSFLAERLTADLNAARPGVAAHVPMDGFHLADVQLQRLGRLGRKGAPDTFDGWGYAALLARLRAGGPDPVYAPGFERTLEQPIAGAVVVEAEARIVVSEGNYLLLPDEPWLAARAACTEVWFCAVPDAVRLARLVGRHMRFGRTETDARDWAASVDGPNAALIDAHRDSADVQVSTGEPQPASTARP